MGGSEDIKEFYPFLTAEYAIENEIDDKPAYTRWVLHAVKKITRIILKVSQNIGLSPTKFP